MGSFVIWAMMVSCVVRQAERGSQSPRQPRPVSIKPYMTTTRFSPAAPGANCPVRSCRVSMHNLHGIRIVGARGFFLGETQG
jgi:hypothetical protein